MAGNRHARRSEYFKRALRETDPVKRDIYLAEGESKVVDMLTGHWGDPIQDPRSAHLVSDFVKPEEDPHSEAYWIAGNLALKQEYNLGHGWLIDPTDPIAEV